MGDRQSYEDSRKGYPVTFDNLSEEYERYREDMVTALAAKDEEIARLRVAITKLYRSPLLDESGYHERGEDIPEDVWDACEVIRQVLAPRPTEGGERD